jgi:hypothetical protein
MKRLQLLTQVIGMVTLILLAVYGALTLMGGARLANAAGRGEAVAAGADIPSSLNYQGFLRDSGGIPVTGIHTITAKIYAGFTGGAPLYTTEVPDVVVVDGLFNLVLGDDPPLTDDVFADVPRYIGISLDGAAELAPRQRLHAVPWAMTAKTLVSDASLSGNVSVSGDLSAGGALSADSAVLTGDLSVGGTMFGEWSQIDCGPVGFPDMTPGANSSLEKVCESTASGDGFLLVVATAATGNNADYELFGKVISFAEVLGRASVNAVSGQDYPVYSNSFTMPVKKGDTWEVWFEPHGPHNWPNPFSVYWFSLR